MMKKISLIKYGTVLIFVLMLGMLRLSFAQLAGSGKSINSLTNGLKAQAGYFNFYVDEVKERILLEVDKIDSEFLYVNTLPAGGGGAGDRGNIGGFRIVKFVKAGQKILLVEPNYDYRALSDNPYEVKAVKESFPESAIWGFMPLVWEGNKALIDLTPFLMRDSHHAAERIGRTPAFGRRAEGGAAAYRIDESRSSLYLENTKNFPKNSEFEVLLTFTGKGAAERSFFSGGPGTPPIAPDPSSVTIRTHHSFIELPEPGYKPRGYDPRSGFNSMEYVDFATPIDQPVVKKFVRRWRLEKKDPRAALSEVVKPIVYYVDRGAPEDVKKALIAGGNWWNEAFEAAGFKNAFQVKELPEGADPMDIRYSVVNWVHRPSRGFSNGVGIFDPRTGEIIKGEVTLGSMRDRQDFLIFQGLNQIYGEDSEAPQKAVDMALRRISQLAAHEIGHTLGFYHNHLSSVHNRSSVTDYPFPWVTLTPDGKVDISQAYTTGIGDWDKRAVMWAYAQIPPNMDEKAELEKIMQTSIQQGHVFMFDLTAHPQTAQWDNGTDAGKELVRLMEIRRKVLSDFSEKAIPMGAPMATLEEVLVPVYLLHRYQMEAAAHVLGGLDFRYALRGDGQVPTKLVDPGQQWQAFDALLSTVKPEELALPEKLIELIPPYPPGYSRSKENFEGHTGVTFDPIGAAESIANTTFGFLLDPERAARLLEHHAREKSQPGLMEVIDRIVEATWKSTPTGDAYLAELHRMANVAFLKHLLALAADERTSDNVKSTALAEIYTLKEWLVASSEEGKDPSLRGNILLGLQLIANFEKDPASFQRLPELAMPAGAPIG